MTSRFVLPLADVGAGLTPSSGAQLFFYETGTTTPKDTYSDSAGTTPNANPVVADSVGVFPDIFISGTYKVVLKNAANIQQWAADPVIEQSNIATLSANDGSSLVGFIQDGAGAVASTAQEKLRESVNVKDFGAVGDGAGAKTDNAAAFEACRDYCITNDKTFYVPQEPFWFGGNIDLWGVRKIDCHGSIRFDNTTDTIIVGGNTTSTQDVDIYIFETQGTIQVYGLNRGKLRFVAANTLYLYASDAVANRNTVSYSTFEWVNVDTLHLECQDTASGVPWINENTFLSGRVRNTILFDGTYPMNNNKFYGLALESVTVTMTATNGTTGTHSNQFHDVRLEGTVTFTFGAGTFNNMFWQSWSNFADTMLWDVDSGTYNITDNGNNNRVVSVHHAYTEKDAVVSYDNEHLDDEEIFSAGTTDTTKLKVLRNAAIFFDTGLIRVRDKIWFNVFSGSASPASLKIFLSPYDADGNIITTEPTSYKASQGSTSWNASGYWEYTSDVAGGSFAINPNADAAVAYVRCWARTANGAAGNEIDFLKAEVVTPTKNKARIENKAPKSKIDVISNRVTSTSEATALDLFKFTSTAGATADAAGILSGTIYLSLTAEKGADVDAASGTVQFQVAREDSSGILTITTGTPSLLSNGGTLQINSLTFATKAGASATEAVLTLAIGTNLADPFDELNAKARLVGVSDYMGDSVFLIKADKL